MPKSGVRLFNDNDRKIWLIRVVRNRSVYSRTVLAALVYSPLVFPDTTLRLSLQGRKGCAIVILNENDN